MLHDDRTGGAAGHCVPVPDAGDAEERQHVRLGAGLSFCGASHKPSEGKMVWYLLRTLETSFQRGTPVTWFCRVGRVLNEN